MKNTKRLNKAEVLQIPELVKTKTYKQIADMFEVTESAIKQWVVKLRKIGSNHHKLVAPRDKTYRYHLIIK